jgi:ketosteroid isomerase-like protein
MSQENVDFVAGLVAAPAQMDKDELLAALPALIEQACDPEIEWVEDPHRADTRIYRGHEGVLESFQRWLENFDNYSVEVDEIRDCGDRVLVVGREQGSGRVSGAPVVARIYVVLTFRDGKVLRYREFYDEQMGLEAAGLSG